jgi:CRISPR-associated protein Cas5t
VAPLWLHLRAPFAAFRWLQAGVWRGTSPVIPPSAAWGLVLNLAAIDTRLPGSGPTTLVRPDAPAFEVAIARVDDVEPERCVLYQQLHSYPVGTSGKEFRPRTHGAKYWIAPVRREILVGLNVILGVRADEQLVARVRDGLAGRLDADRYGLPFAGDNNLLFDRIDVLNEAPAVRWYIPVEEGAGARPGSCRLTVSIDRADSSRTKSALFAPAPTAERVPPPEAWVRVGPSP